MATAYQCDFCGGLYSPEGCIPTSINIASSNLDICPTCLE